MSHFELVSIFYYRAKSIFGLSKSFRRIYLFLFQAGLQAVKLVHNSSAGKLVFSLKTSIVKINGSGIVDSGVIPF